jgi:hypothetical protein
MTGTPGLGPSLHAEPHPRESTLDNGNSRSNNKRFNVHDLAADIWDAAELEDATPLAEWIGQQPESDSLVVLLEERPAGLSRDVMFSPNTVYFGKAGKSHIDCVSRGQAELIVCLANLGISGQVKVPAALGPGLKVLDRVNRRVERARTRFKELAESRTGDERVQAQLVEVLERWFVVGRETPGPGAPPETGDSNSQSENPEGS